jgi:hypothetical protein
MITVNKTSKNKSENKIISNKTNFETRYEDHMKDLIPNLIFVLHHKTSKTEHDFKSNDSQNV